MNYDMFLVHTVAVVLLKVADLFAGILLCFLGKSLFERGIKADFAGEGTVSTVRFKLVTSSPGAIFLVAGLAIVIMSVTTQAKFVELVQSGGVEGSQGSKMEASQAGKSEVAQGNKVETVESRMLHTDLSGGSAPNKSEALTPEASEVCSMLRMYTRLHGTANDNTVKAGELVRQVPIAPTTASVESTKQLLRQLFAVSPSSLLRILDDRRYSWMLQNPAIVSDLTDMLKGAFEHK